MDGLASERQGSRSAVTVSIVNHGTRELLLACLESLSRSDAEIVVLDNASEDGSVDAAHTLFPQVRVIAQQHRAGYGANHNTVIRSTRGRYVLVLNADMRVRTGAIEKLAEYLDEHPEVAVVGPLVRDVDGRQQPSALRLMTLPMQLVWALTLGQWGAVQSRGATPKRVGAVAVGAALFRRDALEDVGLFDEEFFMYGEESDLGRRMERRGFERCFLPTAEVIHHGQQSTAEYPERQINETWRSLDLYLARYHSPLEGKLMRWLTGLGYALASIVAEAGTRLPARFRPSVVNTWNPTAYRLHVRNAFRGTRGPGFKELADDWNRARLADLGKPSVTGDR